jgi:hypothetical protein
LPCCIHVGADCCAIDLILSMCLSLCEGRPASALALRSSPGIARRIEIAVPEQRGYCAIQPGSGIG